jgi:cupin superfamily acireductone dioxygenase involved in methionine salvage
MNFYMNYFNLGEDSDDVDRAQASHHFQSVDSISLCEDKHQFEEFCNEFERGDFTFMRTV